MKVQKMISMGLAYAEMTQADLAEKLETTPQNLSNRIKRGSFSYLEMSRIAEILGGKFQMFFEFEDGTRIG